MSEHRRFPPKVRRQTTERVLSFLAVVLFAGSMQAHPISVVVESAFVESDKVVIDVECFAEDLYFYHDLKPNERNEVEAAGLRLAAEQHSRLLIERLPVFGADGQPLPGGKVVSVTGNEFPEDIPLGELMGHTLIYRIELPFAAPPEFLSFSQRLVDEQAGFPALVDFRVKQSGHDEEVEATLKPGDIRTVRFDWSSNDSKSGEGDREEWMQAQREDTLGATALNTIRSFLYITRREVRHELLIPFPLLESFFTVDREQPDFLSPNEQDAARAKIGDYFRTKNPLEIDGVPAEPDSMRIEFFTLDDRDLTQSPKRRTVSAVNARVGILLAYPVSRPASEVKLVWKAFNRQAWRVDAFCFADGNVQRPKFSMATRSDTFIWNRPTPPDPLDVQVAAVPPPRRIEVPWLALGLSAIGLLCGFRLRRRPAVAGGTIAAALTVAAVIWPEPRASFPYPFAGPQPISSRDADDIVRRLHHNLYLATKASTHEDALDALAAAADGVLLRDLYLRLVQMFREADESGAMPVTEKIEIVEGRVTDTPATTAGFDYLCRWDVTGRVEHWGHVHDRRYRYEALFRIEPRSERWVMTDMDLRDARLIEDAVPIGAL